MHTLNSVWIHSVSCSFLQTILGLWGLLFQTIIKSIKFFKQAGPLTWIVSFNIFWSLFYGGLIYNLATAFTFSHTYVHLLPLRHKGHNWTSTTTSLWFMYLALILPLQKSALLFNRILYYINIVSWQNPIHVQLLNTARYSQNLIICWWFHCFSQNDSSLVSFWHI